MNAKCSSLMMFAMLVAHAALAGCATGPAARHKQHHPSVTGSQAPVPQGNGSGAADKQMNIDMTARCQMHRDMMGPRTEQERRAMMEQHMKGMSPEAMQKHMAMMHEKCK